MDYQHQTIEEKWQAYWAKNKTFGAKNLSSKPKYYVLDMFPYPSGAGLHVGHPLGYIASDIYSRYKRHKGFNVLHPMGYDAYGLPAEQYAIQTGTHPAITTEKNIARYREQLDKIGLSFDWDREVRTCEPSYYKWTQWTFIRLFHSYYDKEIKKAQNIDKIIEEFSSRGNAYIIAACNPTPIFDAKQWNAMQEKEQQDILMNYRLAYLADTAVNWCPALGTVLANDEVSEGYSVRGGHPVERKKMKQWLLRITAYADRLIDGLDNIDWSDSLKEVQRNWIGRSEGAMLNFPVKNKNLKLSVFTTRADTIFGVTYMTLAPENEYVLQITSEECKESVLKYITETKNRSERERLADVKRISGVFTGAFAINPFNNKEIPIWIGDYVLAGYGTGAVMAVPAHDSRDYAFAHYFGLPIKEVISGGDISKEAYESKEGIVINSEYINGMIARDAIKAIINKAEELGIGSRKINYRLRDAIFSRQRYWGEPFPVYYENGIPYTIDESKLPLLLPDVDKYLPTESGEPPLARAKNWTTEDGFPLETNTMPGFAGSSAYYLRYMDSKNDKEYFSKQANDYWQDVDLYIGGAEHATGHLIYSRFWNKFLYDLGLCCKDEPFKKLINQGMINGVSMKAIVVKRPTNNGVISYIIPRQLEVFLNQQDIEINITNENIPVEFVSEHEELTIENLFNLVKTYPQFDTYKIATYNDIETYLADKSEKQLLSDNEKAYFIPESVLLKPEVEKMSKSKFNVQNPDDLVLKYGADTLRMYEMFLGPLEQHKPWDTKGIEGVYRFLKKFWKLFHQNKDEFSVSEDNPSNEEYKILHKTIKKVTEDIERFSFNTAVSSFMICVNELMDAKCYKKGILEPLVVLLSPYAPHITEELWQQMEHNESIALEEYPLANESFLTENAYEYPVSFNGKMRYTLTLPIEMSNAEIEKIVLEHTSSQKWLEGKAPKKIIIVNKKIINIVV